MSFQKRGLGRGLDALMGTDALEAEAASRDAVTEIRIGDIDPNPDQPRANFDETALKELAESIQSVGVLQPILVWRASAAGGPPVWRG